MEKVSRWPLLQTLVLPLIGPGVAGRVPTVTASDWADEVPQAFFAATVTLPLFAPTVVIIVLVVEVPVHPFGRVHI
jgi:hypothetical protein